MKNEEIRSLLQEALFGRLGLSKEEQPYVLPFCFFYENDCIYVHCGLKGQKLDYMAANKRVCFQVDDVRGIITAPLPCNYYISYRSVIAFGKVRPEDDKEKKQEYLAKLAAKYTKEAPQVFTDKELSNVNLFVIEIDNLTGKKYPPAS